MNTWVLILILLGSTGNSITTQKFENKQLCESAGEEAKKVTTMSIIRYTCVPAGRAS